METIEFLKAGFRASIAVELSAPDEGMREVLDQVLMSLPLACVLGITKLAVGVREDGEERMPTLTVEVVPLLAANDYMYSQCREITATAFEGCFGGRAEDIHYTVAEAQSPEEGTKEKIRTPSHRIILPH